MSTPTRRTRRPLIGALTTAGVVVGTLFTGAAAAVAEPELQPGPEPTIHTQEAFDPESDFTAKWTRADARQLKRISDPDAPSRANSMPAALTMPEVPQDFPTCRTARSGSGTPGR